MHLPMGHIRQHGPTCGAVAYASIVGCSEEQAVLECQTKLKGKNQGTETDNVVAALKKRNIPFLRVWIDNDFSCMETHLKLLSFQYKTYVVGKFVSQGKRGRPSKGWHAFAIHNGDIYDSAESESFPIEAYYFKWNKYLWIHEIIIVGIDPTKPLDKQPTV